MLEFCRGPAGPRSFSRLVLRFSCKTGNRANVRRNPQPSCDFEFQIKAKVPCESIRIESHFKTRKSRRISNPGPIEAHRRPTKRKPVDCVSRTGSKHTRNRINRENLLDSQLAKWTCYFYHRFGAWSLQIGFKSTLISFLFCSCPHVPQPHPTLTLQIPENPAHFAVPLLFCCPHVPQPHPTLTLLIPENPTHSAVPLILQ
jgi:hypothetical protein